MASSRVVMRPMQNTSLLVPLVFPGKLHFVTRLQRFDAWRKINVVGDQHRLAVTDIQNEALVAGSPQIIREHFHDTPAA